MLLLSQIPARHRPTLLAVTIAPMRVVVQRVATAAVTVDGTEVSRIGPGLLLLTGVAIGDTTEDAAVAAGKIASLRLFGDEQGRMNRSVVDVGGAILVVSQFTLVADLVRGRRPSFTHAADPDLAEGVVASLVEMLSATGIEVSSGVFGAKMEVSLVNDGPVTFVVDVRDGRVTGSARP